MLSEAEKAEIRSEFRCAKDPEKQITISAQLHACTPEEVRAVLEGVDLPKDKPKQEKKGYDAEFKARAVEEVRAGRTVKSVAEQYNIADVTLRRWIAQATAQKKEPVQAEPQPSPAKPELSEDTIYRIRLLLIKEVSHWNGKLKAELMESGKVLQCTLDNLRAVLLAKNEFSRVMLPGKEDGKK